MEYVFVYGTLKRGFRNHKIINKAEFIREAKTKERFALYKQYRIIYKWPFFISTPYVSEKEKISRISGEVYKVSEKYLSIMDKLEGHPLWYTRKKCIVVLNNGKEIEAWIYFNNQPRGSLVYSGKFA